MRSDYSYLTDATKATLEGNVKAVAQGWGKSERYIYQILAEEKPDFFAPMYEMYIGVLKGGVPTCHFDNDLEYAHFRYGNRKSVHDETTCFTAKLRTHNSTMTRFIEALADGRLNAEEIKDLELCLNDEEQNLAMIRTMLNFKKELLENGSFSRSKSPQEAGVKFS